ncbi:hypothetical protein K3723_10920 [Leisingera caerulea]|uniref:hypothetical protein n=1 Tax=Leisingera caerulea TaxID=506591 RepID=UPI0021A7259B|nr:hypothetical protein [Leisingera caerulea]UWQ61390.1 hypothetical protein K3723_10920 [Leisingera caerulea]
MTGNRAIQHPSCRVPMLTWWEGIYDQVFVALHPFYRIRAVTGSAHTLEERGHENLLSYSERPLFDDDRAEGFEDAVKRHGEAVSWAEVHEAVAPDLPRSDVYLAIWLLACIGYQNRAGIDLQKRLAAYCQENRLYLPEDDGLPAILEPVVQEFLSCFGCRHVTAWDEFRHHSDTVPLSVFRKAEPCYWLPQSITSAAVWGLHLPDPGVLMTWGFDGTEAIIAMTSRALEIAKPENFFEGWYAGAGTYEDVFNPVEFLNREQ